MPRKTTGISHLTWRKELLIAESELNRAHLFDEWAAATEWHRALSTGVKTAGSIASIAALLVTGGRVFQSKREPKDGVDSSWVQPLMRIASLIPSLWETLRSRASAQKEK